VVEEERGEDGCGVAVADGEGACGVVVADGGDSVRHNPRPLGALARVRTLSAVDAGHRGCR